MKKELKKTIKALGLTSSSALSFGLRGFKWDWVSGSLTGSGV